MREDYSINDFTYAEASVWGKHSECHDVEPPLISFCLYPTANSTHNDVIEVRCTNTHVVPFDMCMI